MRIGKPTEIQKRKNININKNKKLILHTWNYKFSTALLYFGIAFEWKRIEVFFFLKIMQRLFIKNLFIKLFCCWRFCSFIIKVTVLKPLKIELKNNANFAPNCINKFNMKQLYLYSVFSFWNVWKKTLLVDGNNGAYFFLFFVQR